MKKSYTGACHCGAGHMEEFGGDFFAVNVACLEAPDAERAAAADAVLFEDGRNDDWGAAPPRETRHL